MLILIFDHNGNITKKEEEKNENRLFNFCVEFFVHDTVIVVTSFLFLGHHVLNTVICSEIYIYI